ncbi:DsbA family protein [Aliiroseovarius sp. YM-037]|uniref:DsbA family protein n=1 Tax=Aliiroseovarius sp. YM-037 TaxID=3341728 RepID=UPI003A80B2EE
MLRPTLTAAAAAIFLTTPAAAFDLSDMTDAEREAFRAEIRTYLLENPEIIMEAVDVLEQRQADAQAATDETLVEVNADALYDDGFSYVGGNPDGDITIVEFIDYRCGYCRRAHPEVAELLSSDGNIRLIVKEFPILGEQSVLSSQFAVAVKQLAGGDAYKAVSDALIAFRGDISRDALERLAIDNNLDADAIFDRMSGPEVAAEIQATRELAQRLQISGTPTFVLAGQMLRGYLPLEGMQEIVEGAREG